MRFIAKHYENQGLEKNRINNRQMIKVQMDNGFHFKLWNVRFWPIKWPSLQFDRTATRMAIVIIFLWTTCLKWLQKVPRTADSFQRWFRRKFEGYTSHRKEGMRPKEREEKWKTMMREPETNRNGWASANALSGRLRSTNRSERDTRTWNTNLPRNRLQVRPLKRT